MIIQIAWKNVWRNKVRSLVVISAVTIGVFAGVFSIAVMNSSVVQRIDAAVNEELSHIQINNRDFRNSHDIGSFVPSADSLTAALSSTEGVENAAGRIIIQAMASTARKSTGIMIYGIDAEKERSMFTLKDRIIPGTGGFFATGTKYNTAVVGEKLAKELNIIRFIVTEEVLDTAAVRGVPAVVLKKAEPLVGSRFNSEKRLKEEMAKYLSQREMKRYSAAIISSAWSYREGSKIILSFVDIDGNQTGAAFRISGVFRTSNDMFEASTVFVPYDELCSLTGITPGSYHQIIVRLNNNDLTGRMTKEIRAGMGSLEVLNWKEIQPDLAMIADFMQQIYAMFMLIILAALSFGIVNTMLMAVLERTREIGMLAAIGMNRSKIFMMIMTESVFLSLLGGISGMAVGKGVIALTARHGINLAAYSEGMEAMGYSVHLFPVIDPLFFFITTCLIVLTGILSSVYPARKALKLNPVEALRGER